MAVSPYQKPKKSHPHNEEHGRRRTEQSRSRNSPVGGRFLSLNLVLEQEKKGKIKFSLFFFRGGAVRLGSPCSVQGRRRRAESGS
ncbi:hypothetical protein SLEP1_g49621 [Rubroshorea leprosula]|uniref:Uncharacterized protein n=1 Tax=Rubroshorea leprosula TaxID=152421 RepID=A0AAV5LXD1_9ROSI|nr:hypothetical protein SLEP1_g49621 [Rubroshorea leprosula]